MYTGNFKTQLCVSWWYKLAHVQLSCGSQSADNKSEMPYYRLSYITIVCQQTAFTPREPFDNVHKTLHITHRTASADKFSDTLFHEPRNSYSCNIH